MTPTHPSTDRATIIVAASPVTITVNPTIYTIASPVTSTVTPTIYTIASPVFRNYKAMQRSGWPMDWK